MEETNCTTKQEDDITVSQLLEGLDLARRDATTLDEVDLKKREKILLYLRTFFNGYCASWRVFGLQTCIPEGKSCKATGNFIGGNFMACYHGPIQDFYENASAEMFFDAVVAQSVDRCIAYHVRFFFSRNQLFCPHFTPPSSDIFVFPIHESMIAFEKTQIVQYKP
jgi:hypothetical protein